jgi:hypothetical protein
MKRRQFLQSLALLTTASAAIIGSNSADARRGRPASPTSVAGVSRRSRRRRRRRVHRNQTLHSLPYGCSGRRRRGGVEYYYCGGIWYRPAYQGTNVVYIVDDIDAGANTDIEFED